MFVSIIQILEEIDRAAGGSGRKQNCLAALNHKHSIRPPTFYNQRRIPGHLLHSRSNFLSPLSIYYNCFSLSGFYVRNRKVEHFCSWTSCLRRSVILLTHMIHIVEDYNSTRSSEHSLMTCLIELLRMKSALLQ